MAEARQTPRGARPNRRGELARFAESVPKERAPFCAAQAAWKDEPSGRLLEPHREVRPRGMIVTEQAREGRAVQNPAYRLIRHKVSGQKVVKFSFAIMAHGAAPVAPCGVHQPVDPCGAVTLLLITIALLACYVFARRATIWIR
jgi:hypothetical protein